MKLLIKNKESYKKFDLNVHHFPEHKDPLSFPCVIVYDTSGKAIFIKEYIYLDDFEIDGNYVMEAKMEVIGSKLKKDYIHIMDGNK